MERLIGKCAAFCSLWVTTGFQMPDFGLLRQSLLAHTSMLAEYARSYKHAG